MWVYHLRKVPVCIWKYHSPSSHLTRKKLATTMLAFSALSACPSPPILPNNTSLPHHQNQCKSLPSHITVSSVIWKKKLPAPPSWQLLQARNISWADLPGRSSISPGTPPALRSPLLFASYLSQYFLFYFFFGLLLNLELQETFQFSCIATIKQNSISRTINLLSTGHLLK